MAQGPALTPEARPRFSPRGVLTALYLSTGTLIFRQMLRSLELFSITTFPDPSPDIQLWLWQERVV